VTSSGIPSFKKLRLGLIGIQSKHGLQPLLSTGTNRLSAGTLLFFLSIAASSDGDPES
jgi:hypothetical protein